MSEDDYVSDPASPDVGAGLREADADPTDTGREINRAKRLIE
jgi:hypothetical protein